MSRLMSHAIRQIRGTNALVLAAEGASLESERDATDVIGETFGADVGLVLIPASRLSGDFFRLSTRKAGLFIQKFTNYRIRLAILGDIEAHVAASDALRDFVRESNKGQAVWFVTDEAALEAKLG